MEFSQNSKSSIQGRKKLGDLASNSLCSKRKSLSHSDKEGDIKKKKQNSNPEHSLGSYNWNRTNRNSSVPLLNEDIEACLFNDQSKNGVTSETAGSKKQSSIIKSAPSSTPEPEILVLSSDDEDQRKDGPSHEHFSNCSREPCITPTLQMTGSMIKTDFIAAVNLVELSCTKAQIGSYCASQVQNMFLTSKSIRFCMVNESSDKINIEVPLTGVVKILWSRVEDATLLFLYLFSDMAKLLRKDIRKQEKKNIQYDPCGADEQEKRIIFTMEEYGGETQKAMTNLMVMYSSPCGGPLYEHISEEEALEIVKHSLPQKFGPHIQDPCEKLLTYPPPPSKGKITISIEDFKCLNAGEFLNDIIIDFYLTWLLNDKIPNFYRQRTHIFSTYFYKRLTTKPKTDRSMDFEKDAKLSPAEKRHARVKSWTKGIDIFEKDFILVPINEKCHWFLAVICFPGLDSPVRVSDGKKLPFDSNCTDNKLRRIRKPRRTFAVPCPDEGEWSERDEADSEEDIDQNSEFCSLNSKNSQKPALKQPCILIFDSLPVASRNKIVATLRQYLTIEYSEKKGKKRVFDRSNMVGAMPVIPQQNNFSDCGVYILQYADSFFENPVKSYRMPILSLKNWFSLKVASDKREQIGKLIKSLMKPSDHHKIPTLTLNVEKPYCDSPIRDNEEVKLKTCEADLESGEFNITQSTHVVNPKKISVNISNKNLGVGPLKISPSILNTEPLPSVLQDLADSYSNSVDEDLYGDLPGCPSPSSGDIGSDDFKDP